MPVLLLITMLACSSAPTDDLFWREAWEVLVVSEDGGMIDARASIGNTGLLRGQGRLQLDRWSRNESPILYGIQGGPEDIDVAEKRDAVRVGTALIGRYELGDNWTIRASSDQANAILHIDPGGPKPPLATSWNGGGEWTVTAPITQGKVHGWYNAGRRGGLVDGIAVVLRRGGNSRAIGPRNAAFALSETVSIGWDKQGEVTLKWAEIGDRNLKVVDGQLAHSSDGSARLDFRPGADLWIEFKPTGAGGKRDGLEHLTTPERWIAQAAGHSALRHIRRTTALIHLEGTTIRAPGILLTVQ